MSGLSDMGPCDNTSMELTPDDRAWIEAQARTAGFDLAGIAAVPGPSSSEAAEQAGRFAAWVAAGHAGDMAWLQRTDDAGNLLRGDLRRAIPWAQSVIVCAINYNADAPRSIDPADPATGWIARYAWSGREDNRGADYHDILLPQLRNVEAALKTRFGAACETRCYVDTGPIVERDFAQRAGIGWIGKNTCVLNQQQGSWLLLGVIVTSLPLAPAAAALPAADRCGTCTRCIDACPTDALIAPRQMDASRCIAYLTIEKKGPIDPALRKEIGRQVFGCDICQDVCPWNRRAPIAASHARPALINPALAWLASLDGPSFNRQFRGSPLERTGRKRLSRNIAIAMGNSADPTFLPTLQEWSTSDDPTLAEAATWALTRLQSR